MRDGQEERDPAIRTAVRVEGIVQGVGFRPFVYGLATRLGLSGLVGNDVDGVFAEIEGAPAAVAGFLRALEREPPPLARVDRVSATVIAPLGTTSFEIVASDPVGRRRTLIAADTATCDDCLRELADPADRRFGYPFINCTNCGPRFTIVKDVPYDRPLTTMAEFEMCEECAAEYHDPANRRFHAQPTCCPACGPRLTLRNKSGAPWQGVATEGASGGPLRGGAGEGASGGEEQTALVAAAAMLRAGRILAVKGLGGYHLAADAANEDAVAALRARKHREDKPFAIMAADLDAVRRFCQVDDAEAALLASPARPVVLLARRPEAGVAPSVAPGNRQLGIMLPYTPLHHLLLEQVGCPLVLTSGNISDEPIAYRDADALARLAGIADAFLTHDRAIHIRTDDSVVRAVRGRPALVRRSRGYVPEPLRVPGGFPRPVLACGAELKNTFCLAHEDRAFVSHHIGDLENAETLRSFTEGIEHFTRLFDIDPQVVAYDLHPEYLSTKYALDLDGVDLVGVQHHHAHIASCLADNDADGPVIGVAFDGTGYGLDGTIWGGEFLIATRSDFYRAGHLAPVPMPGGVAAIRQPWRMAAAYLAAAGLDAATPEAAGLGVANPGAGRDAANPDVANQDAAGLDVMNLDVARRNAARWDTIIAMARRGLNAPLTSSAGRLFDAVAATLGVRDEITYEGQAAIELEQLANPSETAAYRASIDLPTSTTVNPASIERPAGRAMGTVGTGTIDAMSGKPRDPFCARGADLITAAVKDLETGVPRDLIAARFHNGLAALIVDACILLREQHALNTVALSGGVFQNLLLLRKTVSLLESSGFTVLTHSRVPCNDGGISLGQAVIAGARDRL